MEVTDRTVSFSVKLEDKKTRENVRKLNEYCEKTGVTFSFLMCGAVERTAKELGL